ncbi:MAG TPA: acyloxyacyl hydrolase, partial [Terriglobales bacterium]
ETTHGKFWKRYLDSVRHYAYSKWADGNPLLDDYVGHPMMGSITNYLWIQNDPRGAPLEFGNNREYWHSRLRALAFSTVYSTEWKLGPIGEASIGHNGDHVINESNGRLTTDTGFVSLVTTPVGGTLWTTAEDIIDRYWLKGFQERHRHPVMLTASSFLNPTRSAANLMRLRAPWYRDSRVVRSSSFWSKPVNDDGKIPGGDNELGFWSGLSMLNGHVFGFSKDVYQATWDVRYSRLLTMHPHWALRYAPEVEVLTMISERVFGATDRFHQRRRTYGSGISPVGFQMSAKPHSKWQPFASTNGGFDYFADRILSPQASQMMFSIDLGGGVQYFRTSHSAITLGYRYHHISNANIAKRNPGVDSNIFLVGISRFR